MPTSIVPAAGVVVGAAMVVALVVVGAVVTGVTVVAEGVVVAGVSHTATPPWCEHVPERVCEKLSVPSLHCAVAPGGGVAPVDADANE